MKKLVLVLLLMLLPAVGMAEGEAAEMPSWLELSGDGRVLTARLSCDVQNGCDWEFESSDEALLELLTMETIGDETGEEGQWIASFLAGDQPGEVTLKLRYGQKGRTPEEIRVARLSVGEDGALSLESAEIFTHVGQWFALNEKESQLVVALPCNPTTGYEWKYEISDADALALVESEYIPDEPNETLTGVGGTWTASFRGTAAEARTVTVTLRYARSWEDEAVETRELTLLITQEGEIQVQDAQIVETKC